MESAKRIAAGFGLAAVVLFCLLLAMPVGAAETAPKFAATGKKMLTNCLSAGTVTTTLPAGNYLVAAKDERTCLCLGTSTCADTEAKSPLCIPADAATNIRVTSTTTVSCWSTASSGDLDLSPWSP